MRRKEMSLCFEFPVVGPRSLPAGQTHRSVLLGIIAKIASQQRAKDRLNKSLPFDVIGERPSSTKDKQPRAATRTTFSQRGSTLGGTGSKQLNHADELTGFALSVRIVCKPEL
jgi:hypothetical protein